MSFEFLDFTKAYYIIFSFMDLIYKRPLPNQLFRKFSPPGNSQTVQWLKGSVLPLQGAWVLFLVGELRSCVHCGVAKKEKKNSPVFYQKLHGIRFYIKYMIYLG